jgi:hypothetical protein
MRRTDNIDVELSEDELSWWKLRQFWYGRHRLVMRDEFARWYGEAWRAGTVNPDYSGILRMIRKLLCPTGERQTRWNVVGSGLAAECFRMDVPRLRVACQVARLAGQIWLHIVPRKGKPRLEILWGDMLRVVPDPQDPTNIQSALQIDIETDSGTLRYKRQDGLVYAQIWDKKGGSVAVDNWKPSPIYPVVGWYRDPPDRAMPGIDERHVQAQIIANFIKTDIEHHRHNLPGQRYLTTDDPSRKAGDFPVGPSALPILRVGEEINQLGPPQSLDQQLAGWRSWLKAYAIEEGLPADTIDIESYAQTGAAKAIDAAPAWDAKVAHYEQTLEWLGLTCQPVQLFCDLWFGSSGDVTVEIPSPKPPAIGDPLHREQAAAGRVERGIESEIEQIMAERQCDEATAERIWRRNLELLVEKRRILEGGNGDNSQTADEEKVTGTAGGDSRGSNSGGQSDGPEVDQGNNGPGDSATSGDRRGDE